MSSTSISFEPENQSIHIKDEAKTQHYFFAVFAVIQLFSNGLQIYSRWGEFDSTLFYFFCLIFLAFIGFTVFYVFFNSYKNIIALKDIKYYGEKPFLWTKLRYLKLKNNKIRFINYRQKSKASEEFKAFLSESQISIKS
jgi:hypothetical protein